MQRKNERITF